MIPDIGNLGAMIGGPAAGLLFCAGVARYYYNSLDHATQRHVNNFIAWPFITFAKEVRNLFTKPPTPAELKMTELIEYEKDRVDGAHVSKDKVTEEIKKIAIHINKLNNEIEKINIKLENEEDLTKEKKKELQDFLAVEKKALLDAEESLKDLEETKSKILENIAKADKALTELIKGKYGELSNIERMTSRDFIAIDIEPEEEKLEEQEPPRSFMFNTLRSIFRPDQKDIAREIARDISTHNYSNHIITNEQAVIPEISNSHRVIEWESEL